ncbi:hypothetical protein [Chengkuizengella sediminis]|uniref:hypothetical protein n=1 Tax=Chengkuizengella sediminis TaxID=1885917 RepID=UPI001389EF04|nr:hypothetical protein [Chengkuizengella sediminis]NDI36495.1 hypothetical protein [Chengkuizengella sediminis]
MHNYYQFKVAWCPICSQGWVEIVKTIKSNRLHVMCSECESEWDKPDKINLKNVRTYSEKDQVSDPSIEEVQRVGWEKYILND